MAKWVYGFGGGRGDGDASMKDLLGGKGANLAEMTLLGLPVPPGFVITTEACTTYLRTGELPEGLTSEVDEHLAGLESDLDESVATGRRH